MSEAAPGSAAPEPACPLPLSVLPPNFQKHVDPKAPVPLRMMGAKALVPMGPKDVATALYMLKFDADPAVRETAQKSAAALPDRILSVALRDEDLQAAVLGYFAELLGDKPEYVEMVVLNPTTPDETVQGIAANAEDRIAEIVAQNQLRLLRHPDIVRALAGNPRTRPATIDNVCDFCVRSGLVLEDLPQFKAARRRILGGSEQDERLAAEAHAAAAAAEAAAEKALLQMEAHVDTAADVAEEGPPGSEAEKEQEQKRLSITQQVMKLSVAKKIEWANKKGNKEVRTLLLRDPNKLVQLAVIQSPRITPGEIAKVALSRTTPGEVLQYIYNNRILVKNYGIRVNLVNNPKTPVGVSMRFLSGLRAAEVKALVKNKNVPQGLATAARKLLEKKGSG